MAKIKDSYDLLSEIGVTLDKHDTGVYKGRHVRYLDHISSFDVGDNNFDRWSNSLEIRFDLFTKAGQRGLVRWAKNFEG